MPKDIIKKWQSREVNVAVVGLGYVGLPLALSFAGNGVGVIGIDSDQEKLAVLQNGRSYLHHIGDDKIADAVASGFQATDDFARVAEAGGVILCLPTPLGDGNAPDLSYIHGAMDKLLPHLQKHQVLALESTTYPGTTEEEIVPLLQKQGFTVGEDFFIVYSPEREDPGNKNFSTASIPKIIGGYSDNCLAVGMAMYKNAIAEMIPVTDLATAEMAKLLENIYRAVNIGLVNEMKKVSAALGVDIYEVINAAASKPFGFQAFTPGPGVGGHCIPVDPLYLTWKAASCNTATDLIATAHAINQSMPAYVVEVLTAHLQRQGVSLAGSHILVLGASYKKNIGDLRESPALEIIGLLQKQGAEISYSDPFVSELPDVNLHHSELTDTAIAKADAVVIVTDHDDFDYDDLQERANLIIDTRGRYSADGEKIIRA